MSDELERAATAVWKALQTTRRNRGLQTREDWREIAAIVIRSALMEPSEEVVGAVRDALDKEDQRKACTFDDYARAALRALAMKMLGEG